jgi:hypothetical protein
MADGQEDASSATLRISRSRRDSKRLGLASVSCAPQVIIIPGESTVQWLKRACQWYRSRGLILMPTWVSIVSYSFLRRARESSRKVVGVVSGCVGRIQEWLGESVDEKKTVIADVQY